MSFLADEPKDRDDRNWPKPIPPPSHRHAAPSGPWPWQDLDDSIPTTESGEDSTTISNEGSRWRGYPESLFPNWKVDQVQRSKMKEILLGYDESMIYHVDVDGKGTFTDRGKHIVRDESQFNKVMEKPVSIANVCIPPCSFGE